MWMPSLVGVGGGLAVGLSGRYPREGRSSARRSRLSVFGLSTPRPTRCPRADSGAVEEGLHHRRRYRRGPPRPDALLHHQELVDDVATVSEDDIARALIFPHGTTSSWWSPPVRCLAALMNGKLKEEYGDLGCRRVPCVLGQHRPDADAEGDSARSFRPPGRYMTIKMMLS